MTTSPVGFRAALLGCALALWPAAAARADEPEKDKKAKKKPALYDPKLDAQVQTDKAVARARGDRRRVLVMFGFETCGRCHRLHALFHENAEIRKLLADEYVTVMVDTKAPHAKELLDRAIEALPKAEREHGVGFPFLAVLEGNGKVVTAQRTDALEEGKGHDPERVKTFLNRWVASKVDAHTVLKSGLAQAVKEDKRVFLHFGAPWCGWCRRLDEFLARPEVAELLGPDYVDLKIDTERMEHGADVFAEYHKGKEGGIPWFVILDAAGTALATSDGPKGNIGYPVELYEVDHFLAMLKQTSRKMSGEQSEKLAAAVRSAAVEIQAEREANRKRRADALAAELAKLQGRWRLVDADDSDGLSKSKGFAKHTLVIKDRQMSSEGEGGEVDDRGPFKLEPTTDPKQIDFRTGGKGKDGQFRVGIYDLGGERLRICFSAAVPAEASRRPTDFTVKEGSGRVLLVYERVKDDAKPDGR